MYPRQDSNLRPQDYQSGVFDSSRRLSPALVAQWISVTERYQRLSLIRVDFGSKAMNKRSAAGARGGTLSHPPATIQCAWRTNRSDNPAVGERDAAQAAQLIRALCEVRDKMISQMTWLEKHDRQLDAAALRRDVNEAQAHITRLHRRYLGGDVQASQPVRQAR